MAYCSALRTKRSVPSTEIGLMPMPQLRGKRILRTPMLSCRKPMTFFAPAESASHSTPA